MRVVASEFKVLKLKAINILNVTNNLQSWKWSWFSLKLVNEKKNQIFSEGKQNFHKLHTLKPYFAVVPFTFQDHAIATNLVNIYSN